MLNNRQTDLISLNSKSLSQFISRIIMRTAFVVTIACTMTACQKAEDSETPKVETSSHAEVTANSSNTIADTSDGAISDNSESADNELMSSKANEQTDYQDLESLPKVETINDSTTGNSAANLSGYPLTDSSEMAAQSNKSSTNSNKPTAPRSETQVTEVDYKDEAGRSIHVTFQTSATSVLQANLRMPSGKSLLLVAPPGQGNNPTYRSADGSVELVTHAGGKKIDFIFEGQLINMTAVSAEAEVIKPKN